MIEIDDIVNDLSPQEHLTVTMRGLRAVGIECELQPADNDFGWRLEVFDPEVDDISDIADDPLFTAAMEHEYKKVAFRKVMEHMAAEGVIEPDGIDDEGAVQYRVAVAA